MYPVLNECALHTTGHMTLISALSIVEVLNLWRFVGDGESKPERPEKSWLSARLTVDIAQWWQNDLRPDEEHFGFYR